MDKFKRPLTSYERAELHRKQVFLQVALPVFAAAVIVLAICGLAIAGTVQGSPQINRWGNLSAVYLIIPNLFISLINIVVLYFVIRGIRYLYNNIPTWFSKWLTLMNRIRSIVRTLSDKLVAPVMAANSAQASVKAVFKRK